MKKYAAIPLLFAILVLVSALPAHAAHFSLHPQEMGQGGAALVQARLDSDQGPVLVRYLDKEFPLYRIVPNMWAGPVACGAKSKPGTYPMRIVQAGKVVAGAKINLKHIDYGIRRITVDPKFMKLSQETLARYRREIKLIRAAYALKSPERSWQGAFLRPTDSVVVSKFGRRSIVNGKERSPHSGVDLRGKEGDPVKAPADGEVVLVLDSYFGGLMVVLDHGQGLISNYLHLSKSLVKKGERVKKGQIFALIGKSGRVTGPHLHFGMLVQGVKVDPLPFVRLTGEWARLMGE